MLRKIEPEESLEMHARLAREIEAALTDIDLDSSYPKNFHLYNALLQLMKLWTATKNDAS